MSLFSDYDCPIPDCIICEPPRSKEEKTMSTEFTAYFKRRINEIYNNKDKELRKFFGLEEDPPKTALEMVDRIFKGNYILPPNDRDYGSVLWLTNAPNVPAFNKAEEYLNGVKARAIDIIMVGDPKLAYNAVNSFVAASVI